MNATVPRTYIFTPDRRGLFAEIYFPKKGVYQGTIFDTLQDGLNADHVSAYLKEAAPDLLVEFEAYPHLFDLQQYDQKERRLKPRVSLGDVLERVGAYRSPFYGWSMYEVNGAFMGERGRVDEELTQVVRLMFRFESAYGRATEDAGCVDVAKAILLWQTAKNGRLWEHFPWGVVEQKRFITYHHPWPAHKLTFAKKYFSPISKEITRWIDDCTLFIFGYLVREFWLAVSEHGGKEDEIWVTSFLNLDINAVKPLDS